MYNLPKEVIEKYAGVPFTGRTFRQELTKYAAADDKLERLVAGGSLLRIKNGLLAISPELSGVGIERGLVANMLYGPSYVSYETALAHYGLIPERVVEVRSAVVKRGKVFDTALGRFGYRTVSLDCFGLGVRSESAGRANYLIASPTKALCDLLVARPNLRITSPKTLHEFLEADLRFDFDSFTPEKDVIKGFVSRGQKAALFAALERMF